MNGEGFVGDFLSVPWNPLQTFFSSNHRTRLPDLLDGSPFLLTLYFWNLSRANWEGSRSDTKGTQSNGPFARYSSIDRRRKGPADGPPLTYPYRTVFTVPFLRPPSRFRVDSLDSLFLLNPSHIGGVKEKLTFRYVRGTFLNTHSILNVTVSWGIILIWYRQGDHRPSTKSWRRMYDCVTYRIQKSTITFIKTSCLRTLTLTTQFLTSVNI